MSESFAIVSGAVFGAGAASSSFAIDGGTGVLTAGDGQVGTKGPPLLLGADAGGQGAVEARRQGLHRIDLSCRLVENDARLFEVRKTTELAETEFERAGIFARGFGPASTSCGTMSSGISPRNFIVK